MATNPVQLRRESWPGRTAYLRERAELLKREEEKLIARKVSRICELVQRDASMGGGLTVADALVALRGFGYTHAEASGLILEAMGFKVKK